MARRAEKVFVGLSGGVDSAVSAALLQQEGYEVTGVFIRIAIDGYPCTAGADKLDAMRVAAHLRIPFREIDLSEEYKKTVFEISIAEFAKGRTPNPDALCNREIKFGLFFDWCMGQGADFVATGHYARVVTTKPTQKKVLGFPRPERLLQGAQARPDHFFDSVSLHIGVDHDKDQSYFLWAVSETKLRKTLFPVGHLRKSEVRTLAQKFGLPNAARKDSQGLCFLGPISMDEMLRRELTLTPGKVLNEAGEAVGTHEGAAAYTMGQRHGFRLNAQTPHSAAYYVVGKDMTRNTVTVSTMRAPASGTTLLHLVDTNWIGEVTDGPCTARYRYRQKLIPAELRRFDLRGGQTSAAVVLSEPHHVPVGQSLVLYSGARCLGGGVINSVDSV